MGNRVMIPNQPHTPYGMIEKSARDSAPLRHPYWLYSTPEVETMCRTSHVLVYLQPGQPVKFSPTPTCAADICGVTSAWYNYLTHRVRLNRRSPGRASTRTRLLTPTSERTLRQMSANSAILPESHTDDPQPDFDAPRLIQRIDALAYSLPMITPSGERCFVTLVGSYAAWGETMTALVNAGYTQAEPSAWQEGSASS